MKYLIVLSLFIYSDVFGQNYINIAGFVREEATGEAIINANIYDSTYKIGTTTNNQGFFSLYYPTDSISLSVSRVGYQTIQLDFFSPKDTIVNLYLKTHSLEEVIITPELIHTYAANVYEISPRQIENLPVLFSETDLLKSIQLLPGIQAGQEGTAGMIVRGGNADQNLILLDGVPIYNATHVFGLFSIFNTDAINNLKMLKGGFPARYGGRLSSVLDVAMKDGNNKEFHGKASLGLISSKLFLEGPILSDKTSFMIAARRTYLDLLTRPLITNFSSGNRIIGYYFYDINTKLVHRISTRDKLKFSFYMGKDKGYDNYETNQFQDNTFFQWGNIISALQWQHVWNSSLYSNLTINYSRYQYLNREEENVENLNNNNASRYNLSQYKSGINEYSLKYDFDYYPNAFHDVKLGVKLSRYDFTPGVQLFASNIANDTIQGAADVMAEEVELYVEDDIKISQYFSANAGLRYSSFWVNQKSYNYIQPRFSINAITNNNFTFNASLGRMVQPIHLLTNQGLGLPTDLWVPSTENIAPQLSWQYTIGAQYTLRDHLLSAEVYYKNMENLIEYGEGVSYLDVGIDWQEIVENVTGESYGLELLYKKNTGKWNGWLGYTVAWNYRQSDNLNAGRRFPFRYDRRHNLTINVSRNLNPNISLNALWTFNSGFANTFPVRSFLYTETHKGRNINDIIHEYEGRNSHRMPAYHRLDVSASFTKEKKRGKRTWKVGIYNVYNRLNLFYLEMYTTPSGGLDIQQYALFPIIPSISYEYTF